MEVAAVHSLIAAEVSGIGPIGMPYHGVGDSY